VAEDGEDRAIAQFDRRGIAEVDGVVQDEVKMRADLAGRQPQVWSAGLRRFETQDELGGATFADREVFGGDGFQTVRTNLQPQEAVHPAQHVGGDARFADGTASVPVVGELFAVGARAADEHAALTLRGTRRRRGTLPVRR